ncbi:pentatricopeptide repeat-containing protein At5g39350-like [Typha angustifolia]|uniref:pentatricopeptide repeat-containing protein At5g39350-like n=1 Tax=Typha angustifolia TaxID=59011 RepID=UPI003C30D3FA
MRSRRTIGSGCSFMQGWAVGLTSQLTTLALSILWTTSGLEIQSSGSPHLLFFFLLIFWIRWTRTQIKPNLNLKPNHTVTVSSHPGPSDLNPTHPFRPMRWGWRSLSSRLAAVSSAAVSQSQVAQLHQHLLSHGLLLHSSYLSTKLIHLYAAAGDLTSALLLFSSLPSPPSLFAWTPLLALLSRSGHHLRCLSSYSLMRSSSSLLSPDAFVFPPVLRSASADGGGSPAAVSSLHAESIKFAVDSLLPVSNALISAYSKSGDVSAARRVFDLMDRRDLLSWNSIIAAYAGSGSIDPAMDLVQSMGSDGCEPDIVTWNTIVDGYSRAGRCDEALAVLDRVPTPNVVSWTAVISGYSRSANHEAALRVFRRMIIESNVSPDPDTLSCVISSCRHISAFRNGREAHAYGLKTTDGDSFYSSAGAALATMYASGNRISTAKLVFAAMDPTDVVTWNAVISGFARSGLASMVLSYFSEMQSRGIASDEITIASVLPVCNLKLGKEIHGHVTKHNVKSTNTNTNLVSNALISMYSRSGYIETAHRVFSSMQTKDVVSWNTMIGSYGSHGLGHEAIELVHLMIKLGPKPNTITFTNALMACSHCGLVDEGIELFESFISNVGLAPTMEQYACVVDLLARAARFKEAAKFIEGMPVRPNASVFGALLAASRMYQNVEFGRMAFEQLVQLEPKNPGNFVTMSNIYARAGMLEEAKKVREIIESEELAKPSGHSWIEGV